MADDENQANEISYPTITGPVTCVSFSYRNILLSQWHLRHMRHASVNAYALHLPGMDIPDMTAHWLWSISINWGFMVWTQCEYCCSSHLGTMAMSFHAPLFIGFNTYGCSPDPKTGLWIVRPDSRGATTRRTPILSVIHVDTLLRGTHLLPVFGSHPLPHKFHHSHSLDCFKPFISTVMQTTICMRLFFKYYFKSLNKIFFLCHNLEIFTSVTHEYSWSVVN